MEKEKVICPKCGNGYYREDACWKCGFQQPLAKEIISKLLPPGNPLDAYVYIYEAIKKVLEAYPLKSPKSKAVTDHLDSIKKSWRKGLLTYEEAKSLQGAYLGMVFPKLFSPGGILYAWLCLDKKKGSRTDDFALSIFIFAIMTDLRLAYMAKRSLSKEYGTRAELVSRFLKEEKKIVLKPEAIEARCKRFKLEEITPVLTACKLHFSAQSRSLIEDCPKSATGAWPSFLTHLILPKL